MELNISGAAADLARLYPWLDEAASGDAIPDPVLSRMHIALEEAVMNVAMHGFSEDGGDRMTITYQCAPGLATLTISDPGPEFDPVTGQAAEDAEIGGKGLILLRHFCKDVTYRRVDGQNQLTLRFKLE
jgi:anti-sigma regulatory factor (Ser/Thr protein kinase)